MNKSQIHWIKNLSFLILFFSRTICIAQTAEITFANPFHNARTLVFSERLNMIQTQDEKIFVYNLKTQHNLKIDYNFDSILKICYKKIFRNNFDSIWAVRNHARTTMDKEISIYNFKSLDKINYFFCVIYMVSRDTDSYRKVFSMPVIIALKTDKDFNLLDILCSKGQYVKDLFCINPVPDGGIVFENDSTVLMPLYHPAITTIRDNNYLNDNLKLCYGTFRIQNGKISLMSCEAIKNVYTQSRALNGSYLIDNLSGETANLYAFHSKIPVVYDLKNNYNINLHENLIRHSYLDSAGFLKQIENDSYEIILCEFKNKKLNTIYRHLDSVYLSIYDYAGRTNLEKAIAVPLKQKPLEFKNDIYSYAIITREEIKIGFLKMN